MRRILLTIMFSIAFVIPSVSFAAGTPTLVGLVPCAGPECQTCDVIKLGQNIINFFVAIGAFVAVLIFAYAGFLMVTAAGNTGQIEKAKGMFSNVFIGFVITLAAWLTIDTVMKKVFEGSPLDTKARTQKFGFWYELKCPLLPAYEASSGTPVGVILGGGGDGTAPIPVSGARGRTACPDIHPYCSPSVLAANGFTPVQAKAMSCITLTESGGNPWTKCSKNKDGSDNACGLFQITRGNWNNPALHKKSPCSTDRKYINDPTCNTESALLLFQANRNKPYSDWTGVYGSNGPHPGQPFNPAARTCVETFDPASVYWK